METRGPSVFGVAFRIVLREVDGSYSRRTRTDALSWRIMYHASFWARMPIPKRVGWALSTVALHWGGRTGSFLCLPVWLEGPGLPWLSCHCKGQDRRNQELFRIVLSPVHTVM